MNFKNVLVVTYGRSGSTLLQGLLNDVPGCLVRGENYNVCHGLFAAFKALKRTRTQYGGEDSSEASNPWYGAADLDEQRFLEDARRLVRHQLVPDRLQDEVTCFGFKEIRYVHIPPNELLGYLDFLRLLFPDAAMLVLTRDHAQVARSGWWTEWNPGKVDELLTNFESIMEGYVQGSEWAFQLDYRDLTDVSKRLGEMYAFLGIPFDERRVRSVLSRPHSYQKVDENTATRAKKPQRKEPLLEFWVESWADPRPGADRYSAGGAALLRDGRLEDGWSLFAVDADGVRDVEWGIDSPMLAKRYPKLQQARAARFRVQALKGKATLRLRAPNGDHEDIASLEPPSDTPGS